jgi:hypothetical protein
MIVYHTESMLVAYIPVFYQVKDGIFWNAY